MSYINYDDIMQNGLKDSYTDTLMNYINRNDNQPIT